MKQRLRDYLPDMRGKRIGIYGDYIADEYLTGTIHRFSREAPVFVVDYEESEFRGGGAANAAANIEALGGLPRPFGMIGNDTAGHKLLGVLQAKDIATDSLIATDHATFVKQRVVAGSPHSAKQQILRIDRCFAVPQNFADHRRVQEALYAELSRLDALIISDYGLGTVLPEIVATCLENSNLPCFVDSRHNLLSFRKVTAATPNEPELESLWQQAVTASNFREAGQSLLEQLEAHALLVTRGKNGMALFTPAEDPVLIPIFGTSDIVDVTGAGDTVISAFTLACAAGASFADAARIANYAAGIKVMKRGAATVSQQELLAALERDQQ